MAGTTAPATTTIAGFPVITVGTPAPRPTRLGCRECGSDQLACAYCGLDMTGGKCRGTPDSPGCGGRLAVCHGFGCGHRGRPVRVEA